MSLKRTTSLVTVCGLIVLVGMPAFGQNLADLQLFAPADLGGFGGGRPPSEGYFFTFDQLLWWVQSPPVAKVGAEGARFVATGLVNDPVADGFPVGQGDKNRRFASPTDDPPFYYETVGYVQSSTADTSALGWNTSWGERFEAGWTDRHSGLMVSGWHLQSQSERFYLDGADLFFNDPNQLMFGIIGDGNIVVPDFANPPNTIATTQPVSRPLPVTFTTLNGKYRIDPWSIEVDYMRRTHAFHHGGYMEFLAGVRYMEFNDQIEFEGIGGTLDGSFWRTEAENHIIGPQIGARYFKIAGRWMLNAEGRFTAGFNSQNVHHHSRLQVLAPTTNGFPEAFTGSNVTSSDYQNEWAPLVEVRVELRYLLTRAISLRAGWTGTWADGIARSPGLTDYSLPTMGIDMTRNRDDLFIHGLTFGVDLNR